jgi:hypothetical protein
MLTWSKIYVIVSLTRVSAQQRFKKARFVFLSKLQQTSTAAKKEADFEATDPIWEELK